MIKFIKKYPKDFMIVLTIIIAGIFAVLGGTFADAAKRPFWWHLWPIIQGICIVGLLVAWGFAWAQDKANNKTNV